MLGEQTSVPQSRRTVTVLFADVADSTPLTMRLDPEAVRAVMARFFELARRSVERHGGIVEKYIGDAVMAVFGLAELHEDDALRAARAAAELRSGAEALDVDLRRDLGVAFAIRVGVATGGVVAGGEAGTLVTGAPVNLAARLQAAAAAGEILLDDETHARIRDAVLAEPCDPVALKGFPGPVPTYLLLGVDPDAEAIPRRLDTPLVGRDLELALLRTAFGGVVAERTPHVVTIVAGAGVGKSRLAHEFVVRARRDGARVLRGRCLPYGEAITWWAIAEVVHAAAGIEAADTRAAARDRLVALTGGLEHGPLVADRVATLIGLTDGTAPAEETTWAVRQLLEGLARRTPLVVVVDDIQWAEPALLDLLERLVDLGSDAPLLLVTLVRPEIVDVRPEWLARPDRSTVVRLEALASDAAAELLASLTDGATLPPLIRERVLEAADGNPLFIEQFVGMLIDGDHLRHGAYGTPAGGDLALVPIPPTVRALIAARLDRLAERERPILLRASVVGRTFWWGAVADMSPESERPGVGPSLAILTRRQLVLPSPSTFAGDEAFRFRHVLVRDAAYESLPKSARADLHESFAGWLERRAADRLAEFHEVLGHHLEAAAACLRATGGDRSRIAGLEERADAHLLAAADRAFRRGDMPAVIGLVGRARTHLTEGDPRLVRHLPWLGKALMETGELDDAIGVLDEAIECARATGDASAAVEARAHRLIIALWQDPDVDVQRIDTEAREMLAEAGARGDIRGQALAWAVLAEPLWIQARNREAIDVTRNVIWCARRAGDERMVLEHLAINASGSVGTAAEVEAACRSAIAESGGSPIVEARARPLLGQSLAYAGLLQEGRAEVRRGLEIARSLGLVLWEAEMSMPAAVVEWVDGDLDASMAILRRAYDVLEAAGFHASSAPTASLLAFMAVEAGLDDEATRWLQAGRRAARAELNRGIADAMRALVILRCRQGDPGAALDVAQSIPRLEYGPEPILDGRALAAAQRCAGLASEAEETLQATEDAARSGGWHGLADRIARERADPRWPLVAPTS